MTLRLVPDYCFDTFDGVSVAFLLSQGIRGVVLDVDNTLEPYENPEPGERVVAWLHALWQAGIRTAIVSNNGAERITRFNRELGMPVYYKARKPSPAAVRAAMQRLQTGPDDTLLIGDQIFTDVWAAHNAGIPAVLVPPIRDRRDLLTRTKRLLERPLLRRYRRRVRRGQALTACDKERRGE